MLLLKSVKIWFGFVGLLHAHMREADDSHSCQMVCSTVSVALRKMSLTFVSGLVFWCNRLSEGGTMRHPEFDHSNQRRNVLVVLIITTILHAFGNAS